MAASISQSIFEKCAAVASTDIEHCGGPTLCQVSPTTADELASIYQDDNERFRALSQLVNIDFMGAACQRKRLGMYDFLRATSRFISPKKIQRNRLSTGLMEAQPFVMMGSKQPLNEEYWSISNGVAGDGTAPNGDAYTHLVDVQSQSGLEANVSWWPAKQRVFIDSRTTGGTTTHTAWRIVDAAIQGSNVRLYLVSENGNSFLPASALTFPTTYGLLTRGTANIADPETFCSQDPAINTNNNVPFWTETSRYTLCEDQLTIDFMAAVMENNPYYKRFLYVPQVEWNRQIIDGYQKRTACQAFFGKALPNQTLNLWPNLEQITFPESDIETGYEGVCIGRKANAIGLLELMAECDRVRDLQGNVLNLPELFDDIYEMMRMRQSIGSPMDRVFELWMPSRFRPTIWEGFLRYFKDRAQDMLRLNMDINPKLEQAPFGFAFTRFQLDYPAVEIRLVTHDALDDYSDAMRRAAPVSSGASPLENQSNFIWIFDWSVTYMGAINSNAVTNRTGTLAEQAAVNPGLMCVMQVPSKTRKLVSITTTNVVECAKTGLLIFGIPDEVPEFRARSGNYYDLYGFAS
jgi:hypothetical protein